MNWIILTFISIILLSIVNIIDKYIISKELKDPIMDTFFSTLILTILFISIALIKGTIIFDSKIVTLSILAGLAHSGAILLYFSTLKKMEVSRFVPILSFTPIFVVIYASIFFNEIFSLSTYIGFFFIVLGSFIISLKNIKSIFSINKAIYIGLGVAFLFAIRNILIKSSTINNSIWSILFWIGIGTAIASILFISIHHPHIKKRAKKGIKHLILTSIIAGVAFLMLTLAFKKGPI